MASSLRVSAQLSRSVPIQAHPPRAKRHSGGSATRPLAEPLENRLVLASAGGVEDILLPEYIAQLADPNGNQLPATDAWWAMRAQRNMAVDEPISKVQNLAAHNAFNSLNEGFKITVVPFPLAPNQILSLTGLLDTGARLIELDIHDPAEVFNDRDLILKHGPGLISMTRAVPFPFFLDDALTEIRAWMDRPDTANEVIYLDFEDSTEQNEAGADDPLLPKLQNTLGSLIYTPAERAADGAWPSRAELLSRGKRVIIFSHRNDEFHGRFGVPTEFTDPNGHVWFGSSLAFRANGSDDPISDRGNFTQSNIDDFDFVSTNRSEDPNFFFSVQSDGLRNTTARRYDSSDVAAATRLNVDFLKMDFLFSDDEDADLGSNIGLPPNEPFFDIPQDNRIALLEAAVWSWAKNDPAVDRQMFQDLVPGDGTGAAFRGFLAARIAALGNRLPADTMDQLDAIGAAARSNGRDVAIQVNGRWLSEAPEGFVFPRHFAARSVLPDANGHYEWRVTTAESISWFNGHQAVQSEFGSDFIFAGPINGFQNDQLKTAAGGNLVWMNVHDFDHDGNWTVGNRAPRITSITAAPTSVNEGQFVQLTVDFTDEPEGHTALIDWGDGSPASSVTVLAGLPQQVVISHLYKDDHPATGTPSDTFTIAVTLTDAGGLAVADSTQVTVNNVDPVIGAFASDATFANTAEEGEPVSILASFSDAGILDTHVALVNWGDGSAPEIVTVNQGAGTVTGSHAYPAGGIYTITLSLTDDDTGNDIATGTAVVKGIGLNNGTLFVIGGSGDDHVSLNQTGNGKLKTSANFIADNTREFDLTAVTRIISYLGEGDDHLTISNQVKIPAVIHGGGGNDHLNSGGGPAALLGDAGNDDLAGQGSRGILIGGAGLDVLSAGNGGDVLLGGSTNADLNDSVLLTAAIAWNSAAGYPVRVAAINTLFLEIDDGNEDKLKGGSGLDLYYAAAGDILQGVKRDELVLV